MDLRQRRIGLNGQKIEYEGSCDDSNGRPGSVTKQTSCPSE